MKRELYPCLILAMFVYSAQASAAQSIMESARFDDGTSAALAVIDYARHADPISFSHLGKSWSRYTLRMATQDIIYPLDGRACSPQKPVTSCIRRETPYARFFPACRLVEQAPNVSSVILPSEIKSVRVSLPSLRGNYVYYCSYAHLGDVMHDLSPFNIVKSFTITELPLTMRCPLPFMEWLRLFKGNESELSGYVGLYSEAGDRVSASFFQYPKDPGGMVDVDLSAPLSVTTLTLQTRFADGAVASYARMFMTERGHTTSLNPLQTNADGMLLVASVAPEALEFYPSPEGLGDYNKDRPSVLGNLNLFFSPLECHKTSAGLTVIMPKDVSSLHLYGAVPGEALSLNIDVLPFRFHPDPHMGNQEHLMIDATYVKSPVDVRIPMPYRGRERDPHSAKNNWTAGSVKIRSDEETIASGEFQIPALGMTVEVPLENLQSE